MADIKISELTQAESLSTSDLLESAVPYNGGFLSRRMSLAQLSNYLENYVQHQALTTTAKTIVSAINEIVSDLENNYYKTSQTYSKTQVDQLIAGVSGLHFEVVQQLPTTNIDMNTIYLVPKQDVGTQDIYDEYICLDDTTTPATWEKIGTTEIDLSDYVTDTELTTILNDYVTSSGLSTILANYATTSAMTTALADKVDKVSGKGLSTEDYTTAEKTKVNGLATVATSGSYNDLTDKPTIPTNTDEKVKQTTVSDSSNANYRLLLSKSANDTEETDGVYKDGHLYFNPYDETFTTTNASFSTAVISSATVTSLITGQYYFNLGSGNAVAMLEANSASTTSNPTFVTLPASSGTLALQSEIPTIPTVATGSTFGTLSFDGVDKSIKLTSDAQSSGKDLNNFKTAGIYNFSSANVPTNVPIGTNGVLIVIVFGSNVKQIWMRQGTANSNDHNMYIRMYVNSWSRWHQVFFGEMIGGVENSTTASKAYAINELMNFNGGIYRVTTAISSGGTIAASGSSANVTSTTLSAEIKAIRDALNI